MQSSYNEYIERVKLGYEEIFSRLPDVIVSAPARIDFLNTHQDYKGLPVVAMGINLRTYVAVGRSFGDRIVVASRNMRDLGERYVDYFDPGIVNVDRNKFFGNYLRAAVVALRLEGYDIKSFNAWIDSNVPIGSGLGSSGTLIVSFIAALNEFFSLRLSRERIAELAYVAEHDVLGIPCGRLDQYSSAFGGVILIETKPPYKVHEIEFNKGFFVVFDTGIRHSTADIHPKRQAEIDRGLEMLINIVPGHLRDKLGMRYYDVDWEHLDYEDLKIYLESIPHPYSSRIIYTLKTHRSTLEALKILRGGEADPLFMREIIDAVKEFLKIDIKSPSDPLDQLGVIMSYQHIMLSKYYEVSLPIIDEIVRKSIESGALGAKLSGAGLGGSVIALTRDKRSAEKILSKILSERLVAQGYLVSIDRGILTHEKRL